MFRMTKKVKENLLKEMREVLNQYEWDTTDEALIKIINEWREQKKELLNMFSNHPNWDREKMLIHFDSNYCSRIIDEDEIRDFINWMEDCAYAYSDIKTLVNSLMDNNYWYVTDMFNSLKLLVINIGQFIPEDKVDRLTKMTGVKAKAGQKTSRYLNKVCHEYKLDSLEDYNRVYARVSDALNPLVVKRQTVISLNPIDYLLMSNGNSWASCHTINLNNNKDNNYGGCYCGGTMSYMLDKVTFVYYTTDKNIVSDYEKAPKITRQMFHFSQDNENKIPELVQARLYPQTHDNNSSKALKKEIREMVQKVIADSLEIPNLWTTIEGESDYYQTGEDSVQYPDYHEFPTKLSYPSFLKDKIEDANNYFENNRIVIGAKRICIYTGEKFRGNTDTLCIYGRPNAYMICSGCSHRIESREDAIIYDGRIFCKDCCVWSELEEKYIPKDYSMKVCYKNKEWIYVSWNYFYKKLSSKYARLRFSNKAFLKKEMVLYQEEYYHKKAECVWSDYEKKYIPRCDSTYIWSVNSFVSSIVICEKFTRDHKLEEYVLKETLNQ